MTIHIHPNQILMILGAVLSLMVLLAGWPRRKAVGGFYFVAFSLSVTWWLIAGVVESFVIAQSAKIIWSQIAYIGFTQAYPTLLLFVVSYIRQHNIRLSMVLALMVIPFLTLILAWTNSLHGWLWSGYSQGSIENNVLIYQHGFWFWVHVVYLYSVLLTGLVYLIRNITKSPPAFRRQLLIILAGITFPIITGSMYISGVEPVPGMDITPTGLVFTGMFLAWGLWRYQLLDLLPVARTALIEQLQEGVIVLDLRGRIVDINRATQKLFEWDPKDIYGQDFAQVSPALAGLVFNTKELTCQEISLPGMSATILEIQISTLFSETHQEAGKLLVLRDITRRKQADEALGESEARYQTLVESSPDSIGIYSEGRVVYVNPATLKLFHAARPEDLVGIPVIQLVHPDYRASVAERVRRSYENHPPREAVVPSAGFQEEKFITLDGQAVDVEVTTTPILISGKPATQIIIRDISTRKQAEASLRESEGRYHSLFDRMLDGVYRSTHAGKFVDVNPVMVKMFGYTSKAEMLEMDIKTELYFAPEERGTHKIDTGQGEIDVFRLRRKDGSEIWVEDRGTYEYDEQGRIIFHEGIMRDVTQRVKAEEALRESEAMLKRVQEVARMGSWKIDLATKTVIASEEAHRVYGIDPGSMTLAFVQSIPLLEFRPLLDVALTALITEGKRYDLEFKIRRARDGEIRDVHSMAEYSAVNQTIIGSVQDITERKQAQESIQQRVMELETINRISLILRGVSEPEEMLTIVLEEGLAILNTIHGSIELYNPTTGKWDQTITRGWTTQIIGGLQKSDEGINGKVLTSGKAYISREFANDPETWPAIRNQIPHGWGGICLPIRTTHQPLGVFSVFVPSERDLDKDEIRLLETLSEITGAALLRMQLHAETERRAEEFAALYETSNAIAAENKLESVLQSIIEHAQGLLKSGSSAIYLYLAQSDELVLTVNTESYLPIGTRLKKGEGVAGRVAQTRQPLWIDDYVTWEGRSPQYVENIIHAVLEVPMLYGGELIGVLAVDETGDSKRKFSEADERLLSLFASQAAGAIHSSRLHEKMVHRLEHLQALRAVDQAIASSHDLHLTLNILLTQTISQLAVDAADVLLFQPGSNYLEMAAKFGFYTPLCEGINLLDGFAGCAILEHRSRITLDIDNPRLREYPSFLELWKEEGFARYWCVPLMLNEEVKGILEVYRRTAFTPDEEWLEFLEALAGQAAITIDNAQLFGNLQRANLDLGLAYDATIEGWSRAMDLRDHETEGHTLRVTDLTLKLARAMRINESQLIAIRRGTLLHDIGKMGVPDSILLKAGPLTDEEWGSMRSHPRLAYDMLAPIAYLKDAIDIPYCHHEKWDGTGYPQGLRGDQIPLSARIFAVVDVWDALTSDRPYRKKWTEQKTRLYIQEQSGKHFDPQIVGIFLKYIESAAG